MTSNIKTNLMFGVGSLFLMMLTICIIFFVEEITLERQLEQLQGVEVPVAELALKINLDVVQVQQWLTDISATRGAEGFDDGFEEAEKWAQSFYRHVQELQSIKPGTRAEMEALKTTFEAYYDMGKRMAQSYIDHGPEGGNVMMGEFDTYAENMANSVTSLLEAANQTKMETQASMQSTLVFIRNSLIVIIIVSIVLTILLYWLVLVRKIIRPLSHVIALLNDEGDKVTDLSGQISTSSQILADGTTQQAASLEETSSSLEEMVSLTQNNAENSLSAQNTAQDAAQDVSDLSVAMEAIKEASDSITGITKTIDGIAFQTNILSLNAAVEAARAGEAGMGFAVVADEVRNLAMKSGEAAQDIAEKIEDSVRKAEAGAVVTLKIRTTFEEINQYIGEITSASQEQTSGLNQINQAVTQIDQVVQRNASQAEENSAASHQLHAEAESLQEIVHALTQMVGQRLSKKSLPGRTPTPSISLPVQQSPNTTVSQGPPSKTLLLPKNEGNFEDF